MSRVVSWHPEADLQNIREGAQELQTELHRRIYDPYFSDASAAARFLNSPRTLWRRTVIDKFEIFRGGPVTGTVMEIGAGTAWCAALLSIKPAVEHVYAVEYDRYAIEHLMPKVFEFAGARSDKISRVYGSFNHMPEARGQMDFVVSIGAIHHSENLLAVMREVHQALKPGGYFLASEPCEFNTLRIHEQEKRGNAEGPASLAKYGRKVKHKENSDHYYRLCEFEAAAYWAGMDVWAYVFDEKGSWFGSSDRAFKRRRTYDGFRKIVLRPYFARRERGRPVFDRLMLIAQKPG